MFPRCISGVNPDLIYPLPLFNLSRAAFPDGIALESAMVSPTLLGQVCEPYIRCCPLDDASILTTKLHTLSLRLRLLRRMLPPPACGPTSRRSSPTHSPRATSPRSSPGVWTCVNVQLQPCSHCQGCENV